MHKEVAGKAPAPKPVTDHFLSFFTNLFRWRATVLPAIIPQVLMAAAISVGTVVLYEHVCPGWDKTEEAKKCHFLDAKGHATIGPAIAFLLVFRSNLSYDRYYEGRKLMGIMANHIRDTLMALYAYDRSKSKIALKERQEARRLLNILWGVMRQAIRDSKMGYPNGDAFLTDDISDPYGAPSLNDLCTAEERRQLANIKPNDRPSVIGQRLLVLLENIDAEPIIAHSASQNFVREVTATLDNFRSCLRIITTPVPFPYKHMLNSMLFIFVFSIPFTFAPIFHWICPFPSCLVAVAFYGIQAISDEIENPFGWDANDHDLTTFGNNLAGELEAIADVRDGYRGVDDSDDENNKRGSSKSRRR